VLGHEGGIHSTWNRGVAAHAGWVLKAWRAPPATCDWGALHAHLPHGHRLRSRSGTPPVLQSPAVRQPPPPAGQPPVLPG
jgi:hypothetical protein